MKSHLLTLYQRSFGHEPAAMLDLRADGSNRQLYRLVGSDGATVVGVVGPDHEENRAFLSFSRSFREAGLPVPLIHAADEENGVYIEEDLGDTTLFDRVTAARDAGVFPDALRATYRSVVDLLARVQITGGEVIDFGVAYPSAAFDRRSMMWDLSYFKYHFTKLAGIPFNEARLEDDFAHFVDFLAEAESGYFLYRDFQSRNIMLRGGEPWLIDYQGGRRGALQYDVASLLYDAKAALPEELRAELLDAYLSSLSAMLPVDAAAFVRYYRGFVLIRILQAMGAYGYRGFFERKAHFLASVPYAVANIAALLGEGLPVELPELRAVLERIVDTDFSGLITGTAVGGAPARPEGAQPAGRSSVPTPAPPVVSTDNAAGDDSAVPGLTIVVTSFSFKHGYPNDASGHGGGFVFDCRFLHNPGRYEKYRGATGCDASVIAFLERDPAIEAFWDHVRAVVDDAVAVYRKRGFTHLSVAFGCTGGQHRSVYFAERLARHVGGAASSDETPRPHVVLAHRESSRWPRAADPLTVG